MVELEHNSESLMILLYLEAREFSKDQFSMQFTGGLIECRKCSLEIINDVTFFE